jgi:predicted nucleotidyltransferase
MATTSITEDVCTTLDATILLKSGLSHKLLNEIIEIARFCNVNLVRIFGSRARGDYHPTSDIDLAVWGGNVALFATEIDEKTWSLLAYDVVNMDGFVQEELKKRIIEEGVTIYEKI